MKRTRHTPEQIVRKLREADRLLAESIPLAEVMRHLEISHQTYQRWRSQYGAPVIPYVEPTVATWLSRCRTHQCDCAGNYYSMTTTTSPAPTVAPTVTFIAVTFPVLVASIWFSIFMASRTTTVCPASMA